jgi:hypothetical protein
MVQMAAYDRLVSSPWGVEVGANAGHSGLVHRQRPHTNGIRPGNRVPAEGELATHMHAEVAYFAVPTRWIIRDQPLPTIGPEKIEKRLLAAELT